MKKLFRRRSSIVGIFISLILCQLPAKADHLPDKLLARGKPETKLAGIDLTRTKLDNVIRMYGRPKRETRVPNNPNWTGYIWELSGAKIELDVNNGPSGKQIGGIYVEGIARGKVGSTGRGLRLGDTIEAIKQLYGNKFQIEKGNPLGHRQEFTGVDAVSQRIILQWASEEFTLTAGFDDAGKIIALWLILPECYPEPCE